MCAARSRFGLIRPGAVAGSAGRGFKSRARIGLWKRPELTFDFLLEY
jgi:hypothetical protein